MDCLKSTFNPIWTNSATAFPVAISEPICLIVLPSLWSLHLLLIQRDNQIYEYLKHLLTEIPKHMDDTDRDFLDELLPWAQMLFRKNAERIE